MFPTLRIIIVTVIATCAVVLALSAGLVGTRDPGKNLTGVPEVSRMLMRQAIVEEPEWQQFQLLAYSSRRADELLRLRNLPVTPTRAVVEYAERAQAQAAQAAIASAASEPAEIVVATAPVAPQPATEPAPAVVAPAPIIAPPAAEAAPAAAASEPIVSSPASEPAPIAIASAPAIKPDPVETAVAAVVTADPAPAPVPAAESSDTQVANAESGSGATAAVQAPAKKVASKLHRAKTVHASKPKKKLARTRRVAPAAATGFPVDLPNQSAENRSPFRPSFNPGNRSR
jgi:hypothetical protein